MSNKVHESKQISRLRAVFCFQTVVKIIRGLAWGYKLLGWKGNGIWSLGHRDIQLEDMCLDPTVFLQGIDPERDKFGLISGLKGWLVLEAQGHMDSKYENARQI